MIQSLLDWWRGYRMFGSRSPKWGEVRKTFLTQNPTCAICGKKGTFLKPNEVHHIKSFATHPELELDPQNFVTGCREHHQWFFHLGSWQSINENVVEDIAAWSEKIRNRPAWVVDKWVYPS